MNGFVAAADRRPLGGEGAVGQMYHQRQATSGGGDQQVLGTGQILGC